MDKSMLGDLGSLTEEDQVKMATMIDQLQIRDRLFLRAQAVFPIFVNVLVLLWASSVSAASLRMYNLLVERCFSDCVDNFQRQTLGKQEETCVRRCAEKFLKHSMRVGLRFSELNSGKATTD